MSGVESYENPETEMPRQENLNIVDQVHVACIADKAMGSMTTWQMFVFALHIHCDVDLSKIAEVRGCSSTAAHYTFRKAMEYVELATTTNEMPTPYKMKPPERTRWPCDWCRVLGECHKSVTDGGYCGCEKVLVGELLV